MIHHMNDEWQSALASEFEQPYFMQITASLAADRANGVVVFPPEHLIFNAFNATPLSNVKVVLIGQDPYHQPNQAMGLSFSVPQGVRVPPSLRNVFKELSLTVAGFEVPDHGDLSAWAAQGVLLLNASLTVRESAAGSHARIGWQLFTDAVIRTVSRECDGVVFLLWGNFAKSKAELIDASRHHVLTAIHPSPLGRGGFFGCNHFNLTNQFLTKEGKSAIDWQV